MQPLHCEFLYSFYISSNKSLSKYTSKHIFLTVAHTINSGSGYTAPGGGGCDPRHGDGQYHPGTGPHPQ